ncbi:MAG: NUDIX domain-containing protein [Gemmatimonadales bacterium]
MSAAPGPARIRYVDVYPVRATDGGLEVLALRRGPHGRCPGSWEAVHGHLDAGEDPLAGARRELAEETGLSGERWYNLSRVESFFVPRLGEVVLVPAFAVFVRGQPSLSSEHDAHEWLSLDAAGARLSWPRCQRAIEDLGRLLGGGDAGPLEDVLRLD